MGKTNSWEYADLYFMNTRTADGDYGPYIAILEDGEGAHLITYEGKIKVMNRLGADGWIIDTFQFSSDGSNLVSHIKTLAMGVERVGRIGSYSVQLIRRRSPEY